jgi:RimJ/RimL family protein N-acetyltransferase
VSQAQIPSRVPAEELVTERLVLRRYRVADAAIVSEAIEQTRRALEAWTPNISSHRTAAEVAVGLAALESAWTTSRKFVYGLYERPLGRFVGEVGLYAIDWQAQVAEIGMWLRDGAEGRDYGRQAYAAVIGHALDELGLKVLEAFINPANERSRRLAERVGFRLARSVPGTLSRHGITTDMLIYRLEAI